MEVKECMFSGGWLHKFKIRNGITCQMLSGKSKSVPLESIEEWLIWGHTRVLLLLLQIFRFSLPHLIKKTIS